jgi:hypothetical protein
MRERGHPWFDPVAARRRTGQDEPAREAEDRTREALQKNEVKRLKALRRAQNRTPDETTGERPRFPVKPIGSNNADIANNSSARNAAALLMPRSVC